MEAVNWLDGALLALILLITISGVYTGLIKGVFHVLGIIAGLLAAAKFYAPLSNLIIGYINITGGIADILSFIALFAATAELVMSVGVIISSVTSFRLVKVLDRLGGSVVGVAKGLALSGIILLFLTTFPLVEGFGSHIENSYLGPKIISLTDGVSNKAAAALPVDFPRLVFYPEDISSSPQSLRSSDFNQLDGATCIHCRDKVTYLGFCRTRHGLNSPKYICNGCARTSDGCQTFQGYHLLYEQCPAVLGRRGYRFDCGIWTNNSFVRPKGSCPVCE